MHTERNMKKWISLFGVVFVTLWLAGCSAESNVKKGDKFYAIGEYFEAAAEYRKAYMRTKPKERAKRGERAYKPQTVTGVSIIPHGLSGHIRMRHDTTTRTASFIFI